jgi:hypothetical protein
MASFGPENPRLRSLFIAEHLVHFIGGPTSASVMLHLIGAPNIWAWVTVHVSKIALAVSGEDMVGWQLWPLSYRQDSTEG